jgi:hypothetical protein
MRSLVKQLAAFSVLLLLLVAVEGRAQEVMTITNGGIGHAGNERLSIWTSHSFYFVGDGMIAQSGDEKGAKVSMSCNPCAPGETLTLSVNISRFTVPAHGSATLNGIPYHSVWFAGTEFKLKLTPITIPDTDIPNGVKARFTMTGKLIGYAFPFVNTLIYREVEGQGTVRIFLTKSTIPDRPGYMFRYAAYYFEARPARTRKESLQPSRLSPVARQQ